LAVKFPESTKTSLRQRLLRRAETRWPHISDLQTRHHGVFTYVQAVVDGDTYPLCRLRYVGSAHDWQFAMYRASHDDYDESRSHRPTVRHLRRRPRPGLHALPWTNQHPRRTKLAARIEQLMTTLP